MAVSSAKSEVFFAKFFAQENDLVVFFIDAVFVYELGRSRKRLLSAASGVVES